MPTTPIMTGRSTSTGYAGAIMPAFMQRVAKGTYSPLTTARNEVRILDGVHLGYKHLARRYQRHQDWLQLCQSRPPCCVSYGKDHYQFEQSNLGMMFWDGIFALQS